MHPNQKPPVTLEDLLRLKRAERPPVEFWDQFDRDLRAKQLAAIVEPRPWWSPLIRFGARASRYQLPVGAAAILALSFVTIREYRTGDSQPVYTPEISVSTAALTPTESLKAEPVSVVSHETVAPAAPMAVAQEMPAPVAQTSEPVADAMPNQAPASAAFAVLGAGFSSHSDESTSARFLGANIPAQQDNEAILSDALSRPSRMLAVRQPVREPLTQVASPREARLARLLSPGLPSPMASLADMTLRSTDRASRNLTEDRLYDSISRVNASGAGVLVKF